MSPAVQPDLYGVDPVTRAVRVLSWRSAQALYAVSPDGLILSTLRFSMRVGALISLPLGALAGVLLLIQVILDQLGGILTSTIGVGLILLAIAVVVLRMAR